MNIRIYSNIFEYSNIFLRILIFIFDSMQFPEAEYYSNIQIFCSNIYEDLSSKITGNTDILKVSVSFLTWKDNFTKKYQLSGIKFFQHLGVQCSSFISNILKVKFLMLFFIFILSKLFKNIRIFEYFALFKYYSNIFYRTNNIQYSIRSILLVRIIFDIWFGPKKIFI